MGRWGAGDCFDSQPRGVGMVFGIALMLFDRTG